MRCMRLANAGTQSWYCPKAPQAISFTASLDITLHGILTYGCTKEVGTYDVSVTVYNGRRVLGNTNLSLDTDAETALYEIVLPVPVQLTAWTIYTVELIMKGAQHVYYSVDGMEVVTAGDVKFTFSNTPNTTGGTCIRTPSRYTLLYTRSTCSMRCVSVCLCVCLSVCLYV
jgi:hypothetical protein